MAPYLGIAFQVRSLAIRLRSLVRTSSSAPAPIEQRRPPSTGYGGIWITGPGVIYRVDPATARTVATIPSPGTSERKPNRHWRRCGLGHQQRRPRRCLPDRPRHNRVMSFIRLQPNPIGIAVAHGRVWVTEPKEGPDIVIASTHGPWRSGSPSRSASAPARSFPARARCGSPAWMMSAVSTRRPAQYPSRTAVRGWR